MKKIVFLTALLTVLLMAFGSAGAENVCPGNETGEHYWEYVPVSPGDCVAVCEFCGSEKNTFPFHWSFCTNEDPTTCSLCGTTGLHYDEDPTVYNPETETIYVFHDGGGDLYYVDRGDCHEVLCDNCDVSFVQAHYVSCERPDYCDSCGELDHELEPDKMWHSDEEYVDLGEQHALECKICGYQNPEWKSEHWRACTDSTNVCSECGISGINDDLLNKAHFNWEFVDLGTQHQWRCKDCGQEEAPDDHWGICSDKSLCLTCNMKVQIAPENLEHDLKYVDRGRTHRQECTRCDYVTEEEDHVGFCVSKNECFRCGATIPPVDDDHLWHRGEDIDWKITDTTCEEYCTACGHSWGVYEHAALCTTPTLCDYCGSTIPPVDIDHTWHLNIHIDWKITDTTCQWHCNACDYETPVRQHAVLCTDPSVCQYCGKEDMRIDPLDYRHPSPVENITWTTTGHNFDCPTCGAHVRNRAHQFAGGVCTTCGYVEGTPPALPVILPGDASGDGEVDIFDALAVLQYAVGWDTELAPDAADVNDDGAVDIFDALLILQYAVGWDVELK